MSNRVDQAWERAGQLKGEEQVVDTPEKAERLGRDWWERIERHYGITGEESNQLVTINTGIARATIESLFLMRDQIPAHELLEAIHASGFANGLAVGLELALVLRDG